MLIVADPEIYGVAEAFGNLGALRLRAGRTWDKNAVADADVVLVRSTTRIDRDLIEGTRVGFVGSATSGVDHVDQAYLASRRIAFASAAGSNAGAVADYVISAVLAWSEQRGRSLKGLRAGVIGCGRIGSRVVHRLAALGLECLEHDPPLSEADGCMRYRTLEETLQADIVTLHAPLTREGRHATWALLNAQRLRLLSQDALLINTARGGIVDEKALTRWLQQHPEGGAVVDCWQDEPFIDEHLLRQVSLGTAHIAGYTEDAKRAATEMLFQAVCAHLNVQARSVRSRTVGASAPPAIEIGSDVDDSQALRAAVFRCYDVRADAHALRAFSGQPSAQRAKAFDDLRAEYRPRREFSAYRVRLDKNRTDLGRMLSGLDFQVLDRNEAQKKT
ncbi:MAG: 4-phosphoerythronate dehydrogenase [Gammaproteobacteria bacterium]